MIIQIMKGNTIQSVRVEKLIRTRVADQLVIQGELEGVSVAITLSYDELSKLELRDEKPRPHPIVYPKDNLRSDPSKPLITGVDDNW